MTQILNKAQLRALGGRFPRVGRGGDPLTRQDAPTSESRRSADRQTRPGSWWPSEGISFPSSVKLGQGLPGGCGGTGSERRRRQGHSTSPWHPSPAWPGRGAAPPPAPPARGSGATRRRACRGSSKRGRCGGGRARNTGEGGAPKGTHGPLCSPDLGALPLGSSVAHVAARAQGRRGSSKASVAGDALPLERQPGHWGTWALGGAQSSHLEGRRGSRPGPDLRLTHASSEAPRLGNLQRGN